MSGKTARESTTHHHTRPAPEISSVRVHSTEFSLSTKGLCDDAWDGERGALSDVIGGRHHLVNGCIEWPHRKGGAENVGKLGLGAVITRGGDLV